MAGSQLGANLQCTAADDQCGGDLKPGGSREVVVVGSDTIRMVLLMVSRNPIPNHLGWC